MQILVILTTPVTPFLSMFEQKDSVPKYFLPWTIKQAIEQAYINVQAEFFAVRSDFAQAQYSQSTQVQHCL